MSSLSNEHGAINLSQGFPDFPVDPRLIDLVSQKMQNGHNQYAPMQGIPQLRRALSRKIRDNYGTTVNSNSEITITSGATQAIHTAISAVVQEGDEVVIFTPAYDCYSPSVVLNGGKPIHVQLVHPDYHINWKEVKRVVNRHTRMIIINTPHNPTGAVLSKRDINELIKITAGTDIVILSDEVYEHIIFDGTEHHSVLKYPELASRSYAVYSFGKTFHCTGWKLGYCVAPKNLMEEFRKVHQFNVFASNHPMQAALADYVSDEENYNGLNRFYQKKRNLFQTRMAESKFKPLTTRGTYFQLYDYSAISEEKDVDFAKRLTMEHGVSTIPVSVFYHTPVYEKVVRFCFAKSDETLERATELLCKI